MLRLISAHLIGTLIGAILRPVLRLGLITLAVLAAVELPARLWRDYVDPSADPEVLMGIRWVVGGLLLLFWARRWLRPVAGRQRRL